jgi:hypothetical protein
MRADILAGRNRCTGGRRRACLRLAHAVKRQFAERRERSDGKA